MVLPKTPRGVEGQDDTTPKESTTWAELCTHFVEQAITAPKPSTGDCVGESEESGSNTNEMCASALQRAVQLAGKQMKGINKRATVMIGNKVGVNLYNKINTGEGP